MRPAILRRTCVLIVSIGLVNETSNSLLTQPISGLMGLAFQSIAASDATPFWQSLTETSGTLDSPLFAFQLTRFGNDTSSNQLEPGGTFTLGATNSSLFTGDIDYQNIPNGAPGYWVQQLSGKRSLSSSRDHKTERTLASFDRQRTVYLSPFWLRCVDGNRHWHHRCRHARQYLAGSVRCDTQ